MARRPNLLRTGLTQEGKHAMIAVTLDVAERKQVREAVQRTVDRFGQLC